jgi:glucose/arabinose dehydrogenase
MARATLATLTRRFLICAFSAGYLGAAPAAPVCREPQPQAPIPDVALQEVAVGLRNPTHIAAAFDGSHRLFVVEQAGTIRVMADGKLIAAPFLDIRNRVESGGEMGLLSMAFSPRFADNGWFFVNYTTRAQGKLYTHVARFTTPARGRPDAPTPLPVQRADIADAKSETVLLRIEQPYSNHNGGQLAFGPDGFLYIGMGDGGAGNDPHDHAQNLNSLLGKLLRVDVDGRQAPLAYAVPGDNPFVGHAGARAEVWAYGLRNPWRFSFDAKDGRLFLADVGQNAVEEVDVIEKGGNYGWRIMEGNICTPKFGAQCDQRGLALPIQVHRHPEGYSITGGFVYRGRDIEGLCGTYLYADYVTRRLWGLRLVASRVSAARELLGSGASSAVLARIGASSGVPAISSFGEDEQRELYVADHAGGRILRLVAARR